MLKEHATHYPYPEGEVGMMPWKDVLQNYWWQSYSETLGEPG